MLPRIVEAATEKWEMRQEHLSYVPTPSPHQQRHSFKDAVCWNEFFQKFPTRVHFTFRSFLRSLHLKITVEGGTIKCQCAEGKE